MEAVNLVLKGGLIVHYGSQIRAARDLGVDEYRLSRIIHGRSAATPEEKRKIAWKLQRPIRELFPEDDRRGE